MPYKKILILSVLLLFSLQAKDLSFFNLKERNWINNLKTPIRIGITQIPNQVLKTKTGYKGFSIDLFKLISKKSNIKFKYVYFNTWKKVIEAVKHKKIDIVFLAQKTPLRLSYLHFTDTVLTQQNKIIVNINNDKFHNMLQLNDKKVAVTRGSAIAEYLEYNYPTIKLLLTNSELDSLRLLNLGKVDAVISEAVRASYYIKKYNFSHLLISDSLDYQYFLKIATRNDMPMLNVILTKVVTHFSKQIKALQLKWGYSKDKVVFFDTRTFIFIGIVFFIIMFFSVYLFSINRKLKKEIKEKNEAYERLKIIRNSRLNQMSEILSMIAHQWKQPLNNLSLITDIIVINYKDNELNDKIMQEFKSNSKEQINLMIQTIEDFRDFFKIDEEKKVFDVSNVLYDSLISVKLIFKKYNINIILNSLDERYLAYGYSNALQQIILNILNNAKDALNEKEIIHKQVEISLSKKEGYIVINIEDNAGGIPINIIDKIFMPYFSTKQDKDGTGLGLYMAKIIIEEKMDGSVDVFNDINGANFEIKLPLFDNKNKIDK